jgi:DNA modification methylase
MPAAFLATRDIRLNELERFPGNARRGNVAEIRKSLKRHGQYRSLVVRSHDGKLTILAGNHTAAALEAEGHETARCEVIECSDDEARRINLADNRLGDIADDDPEDLALLLAALDGDLDGTGWDVYDLDGLADVLEDTERPSSARAASAGTPRAETEGPREPGPDPDEVPEPPPGEPVTRLGDLWRIGGHMLLCGDSTRRDDVLRLMDGDRACIMVTDPPYGVAYHSSKKGDRAASIAGDLTQAAIPISFAVAVECALDADARLYLFGGSANWQMYASLFDHHLRMQVRPIVWAKEHFILRPNNYHSQFEMVYFGWKGKGGGADFWYTDRTKSDLWQVTRHEPGTERVHPTQKPVEVCAIPVRNSSPPGALVYEPFGGSGSTLIAAHLEGRRCRAMELDPRFCDVILRRFEQLAGITPERVLPDGTAVPVSFT